MKKRFKTPTYHSELFSIESIAVEDNALCIRGIHYDEAGLLSMQSDDRRYTFVCDDATALADMLNTNADDLAEHVRYLIKGHVDLIEEYCRKHGLKCELKEDEI